MMRHLFLGLLIACTGCLATAATTRAEEEPRVYSSRLGAPIGMRQYRSRAWGVVGVDVVNQSEQPAEVLAAFTYPQDTSLQFARQIAVPPLAVRRTWVPVKLPPVGPAAKQIEFASLLIDRSTGREVVLRRHNDRLLQNSVLRVNQDVLVSGILEAHEDRAEDADTHFAYEAAIGLRTSRGYERRMVVIADRDFPAIPEALDGLDELILYNNRIAGDAALQSAIRGWLSRGGHLWIMLERVDFQAVEQLLGDTFTCHEVDRVEVNEVDIVPVHPAASVKYADAEQFEHPVPFVRVATSGMNVTHTLAGWPAAFWRTVGRGRVVFTTVGARAWIRRAQALRVRWDPNRMSDFEPTPELDELPLLLQRSRTAVAADEFGSYLSEQIGYRIVPRGLIAAALGTFCGVLLLAAVLLARRRRLEHLGWVTPCVALGAAVPLVWIGMHVKRQVPRTAGQMQVIEVSDLGSQLSSQGVFGFYNPAEAEQMVGAGDGGVFEPDGAGLHGMPRRMVWTDADRWRWEGLELPTGERHVAFRRSAGLTEPIAARGTFTAAGFEGRLSGSCDALADALVFIPGQPCLAVQADGPVLRAGSDGVLPSGQHVAAAVLSDEQRRREAICDQFVPALARDDALVPRPMLLGWTPPRDLGFPLPPGVEQVGAALWMIPLTIEPAPAGAQVAIPSPFIRHQIVTGPTGGGAAPLYDTRSGEWLPANTASRVWLRFQVPEAVLPFRPERVGLRVRITAPNRRLDIVRFVDGQVQVLTSRTNPLGPIHYDLPADALPAVDASGGLLLGLFIGPSAAGTRAGQEAVWKIDSVQLELSGRAG